jgi:bla regulator protein blaR1
LSLDLPIPAVTSPALLEPGIFGILRPVLLLPEGIFQSLTPVQFSAVVEHELYHVRYADNLGAGIHMFVETVFLVPSPGLVDRQAPGGRARTRVR